jgi:hypothetical protein
VFLVPVVFFNKAELPTAVLSDAVVLALKENKNLLQRVLLEPVRISIK